MTSDLAAMIFCALFALLAMFQLALAMGAPLGRFAWGGGHERLPAGYRIGSIVSIAIYALICAIVLERAGMARVFPDPSIARIGAGVVVGYLGLGIVMNGISRSKPERYTMTPLVIVLFALALSVALSPTG
jgi:hypothetical protein